ncbi:MAG: glycosyltransferase [Actinomycetota bacterium]|nr:glycosyltransferase [Actinomycetota bacterium]
MTSSETVGSPRVAVVGPLPPPTHGHMVVTERVLSSPLLRARFTLLHVDISDHSELDGIGKLSARNAWLGLAHAARLWRTLRRRRPDLVYLPLSQNRLGLLRDCLLLAACVVNNVRVVGHVHGGGLGPFLESSPRWFAEPVRRLVGRCAALITMSHQHCESVRRVFPDARIDVIPHGSTPTPATPRRRAQRLRAVYASSSLCATKGTFVALQAARLLADDGLPVLWTIVGPWRNQSAEAEGRRIVAGLKDVHFTGALDRDGVERCFQQSDLFVFPTGPKEGFGMVRIEAMAAGLPVVTTPAGGGEEIVGDAGFIVPFDSPVEVARRIRLLHDDRGLLEELGARARSRHAELFSQERFERALERSWSGALGAELVR